MHWRFGYGHPVQESGSCTTGCMECVRCHIAVPHGGKVSRLIVTPNAPVRYRIPGIDPILTGIAKSSDPSNYGNRFFLNPASGCVEHYANTTLESW